MRSAGRREQERATRRKVFATFTRDLIRLRCWLKQCKVTDVAMESTGVYWKPVWNVLEGYFDVLLLAKPRTGEGAAGP